MPQTETLPQPFLTRRRMAWALLLAQMLAVGFSLGASGRFQPFVVPDTALYADYPMHSLKEALENHRTPLYPLLLKVFGSLAEDYQAVPFAQYAFFCLAVAVFFRGLLAVGQGEIASAFVAGTLLCSDMVFHFVNEVGSDCPAATGAIFTMGFVLMRLGGRTGIVTLVAIALAMFATWLTRPAYLFLILLVPLVCELGRRPEASSPWRMRGGILAAVILPLLAYCTLQWAVVGRFAVVSLGGYNLIGITGQFLDEETLAQLPDHLKPVGEKALLNRRRMQDQLAMPEVDPFNYSRMESQYDDHLWRIYVPAAEEVLGKDSHDAVNRQLKELATAILRERPKAYLTWLAKAFRRGLVKIVSEFLLNPVSLVLFLLTLSALALAVVRSLHGEKSPLACSRPLGLLFLIAVLFAFMKLGVVISVSIPIERMTMAMGLFVPVVFTAFLAEAWPWIWSRPHAPTPLGQTSRR